jgi:hypothetical protein
MCRNITRIIFLKAYGKMCDGDVVRIIKVEDGFLYFWDTEHNLCRISENEKGEKFDYIYTLKELAAKLIEFLKEMEYTHNSVGKFCFFHNPSVVVEGRHILITYVSVDDDCGYENAVGIPETVRLSKEQARDYLEWLMKGNRGKHFEAKLSTW